MLQINSSHLLLKHRLSVASWAVLYCFILWQFSSPTTVLPFTAKGVLCSNINFQFLFSANHFFFFPTTVNICFLSVLLSKKKLFIELEQCRYPFPSEMWEMRFWLSVFEFRLLYYDRRSGKSRHKHAWASCAFCFPSVVLDFHDSTLQIELFLV